VERERERERRWCLKNVRMTFLFRNFILFLKKKEKATRRERE